MFNDNNLSIFLFGVSFWFCYNNNDFYYEPLPSISGGMTFNYSKLKGFFIYLFFSSFGCSMIVIQIEWIRPTAWLFKIFSANKSDYFVSFPWIHSLVLCNAHISELFSFYGFIIFLPPKKMSKKCEKKNRTNDDAVASSYGARFGIWISRLNKLFRQPKAEKKIWMNELYF